MTLALDNIIHNRRAFYEKLMHFFDESTAVVNVLFESFLHISYMFLYQILTYTFFLNKFSFLNSFLLLDPTSFLFISPFPLFSLRFVVHHLLLLSFSFSCFYSPPFFFCPHSISIFFSILTPYFIAIHFVSASTPCIDLLCHCVFL